MEENSKLYTFTATMLLISNIIFTEKIFTGKREVGQYSHHAKNIFKIFETST